MSTEPQGNGCEYGKYLGFALEHSAAGLPREDLLHIAMVK